MMVSISMRHLGAVLLALTLLASGRCSAGSAPSGRDLEGFARWLFDQGDYYRAIGVYKELLYHESGDSMGRRGAMAGEKLALYATGCAESYRKSGRHRSALAYYARALESPTATPSLRVAASIGMGLTYLDLSLPATAIPLLDDAARIDTSGVAALCQAQAQAEIGRWEEASAAFHRAARDFPPVRRPATDLAERSLRGRELPRKSVTLATLLSTAIPGSGQWYAGHHYDALLAFGYVGTMAGATYAFWRLADAGEAGSAPFYVSLGVTTTLHAANILGARKTVQYRNARTIRDHLGGMREIAFPSTVLPPVTERSVTK